MVEKDCGCVSGVLLPEGLGDPAYMLRVLGIAPIAGGASSNGHLLPSELRPITGGVAGPDPGQGQAAPAVAAAWNACAVEIHEQEGVWIRVTGPDSAYRPYDRQVYWRNYWCGQGACQNAAVPGTSNHGVAWAFDVPDYVSALLEKYGAKYGFRRACSDAPWENWHWHWCGGWNGPDPGPFGNGGGAAPIRYPTLRKGSKNQAAIKRAQKHLRRWNLGLTRPKIDGSFGKNTKKSVIQFQIVHDLHPDGVVGPKTWKILRRKDHFLDDERKVLNLIKLLRHGGVSASERQRVDDKRKWAAARAHSINKIAQDHGWGDQHRRQRFGTLRQAAASFYN